jgi:hypothetical protein
VTTLSVLGYALNCKVPVSWVHYTQVVGVCQALPLSRGLSLDRWGYPFAAAPCG